MTKVIWKFPIKIQDEQFIAMPSGAKILHVAIQNDQVCLWAICTPNNVNEHRLIRVIGTGHPIDTEPVAYIGTIMLDGGFLVLHVFEDR